MQVEEPELYNFLVELLILVFARHRRHGLTIGDKMEKSGLQLKFSLVKCQSISYMSRVCHSSSLITKVRFLVLSSKHKRTYAQSYQKMLHSLFTWHHQVLLIGYRRWMYA